MNSFYFVPLYDKRINLKKGYYSWAKKADCIIFDLEDSLAEDKKGIGRYHFSEAFSRFKELDKKFFIRINSKNPFLDEDLMLIKNIERIQVILPKTQSLEEIKYVIDFLGPEKKISILIETPMGIINSEQLIANPHVEFVFFGPEDLSNALNIEPSERSMLYSASRVINAAAAFRKKAVGCLGAFRHISMEGLAKFNENLEIGKEIGFSGAFAIHYKQIDLINQVYSVSSLEIENIKNKLLQQKEDSVFSYLEEVIGPPMIKRYKKIIENSTK